MRIKSFYDKIGLGSIGLGIDGLFIHSDLTSWMNDLSPYFVFIFLKLLLIIVGIYLLKIYNSSISIEKNSLDVSDQLQKRISLTKKVSQYHWYLMIFLCFLTISFNWSNNEISGSAIAFIIFVFWLLLVWPIIHFWKKRYTNPLNVVDLNNLTTRQELIKYLFIQGNKQYKNFLKILLIFCLVGPIICSYFPSLIGQTEGSVGYGICLLMGLFFTLILWIISLFYKRKNNKIKNYYFSNPDCHIWASEDSEYSLHIKFDEKELEVSKIFLPFSIEECIQIINYDSYQKNIDTEVQQAEILDQDSVNKNEVIFENSSIVIDETLKYQSAKTYNIGLLILFSFLIIPFGFIFSFIYAYIMWYSPFPYINIIVAAVFGVILGLIFPIKWSKCTDSKVAILSALIFAFICHYFGWIIWTDLFFNLRKDGIIDIAHPESPISSILVSSSNIKKIIFLSRNPSVFFKAMLVIKEDFYYKIFSFKVDGFSLYLIWFLEAAIVLFFSAFVSYKRANEPFSVSKNKWLKSFEIKLSYISNLDLLNQALIDGDKSFFENLVSPEAENSFSEIKIWHIDDAQAYINIKNKEKQIDGKGKTKFEEKELVEYVKINHEILNVFLSKSKTVSN
jgi:hypothetical protein